jgi:L-seryl-tRNA(Ser) seleniumtransferase
LISAGRKVAARPASEQSLKEVLGCETATVVNNNAAAVYLVLNTLARGKEVIVSRGN